MSSGIGSASRSSERLNKAADLVRAKRRFLISQTRRATFSERVGSGGLPELLDHLRALLAG
jgi:hypothetical protein